MGFSLTSPAPEKCDPTAKNRVWGFFGEAPETSRPDRPQSLQPRREKHPTTTKVASGRTYWPSRDPIGERGGINLYGMVGNDAVSAWDYLGLINNTVPARHHWLPQKHRDKFKKLCGEDLIDLFTTLMSGSLHGLIEDELGYGKEWDEIVNSDADCCDILSLALSFMEATQAALEGLQRNSFPGEEFWAAPGTYKFNDRGPGSLSEERQTTEDLRKRRDKECSKPCRRMGPYQRDLRSGWLEQALQGAIARRENARNGPQASPTRGSPESVPDSRPMRRDPLYHRLWEERRGRNRRTVIESIEDRLARRYPNVVPFVLPEVERRRERRRAQQRQRNRRSGR